MPSLLFTVSSRRRRNNHPLEMSSNRSSSEAVNIERFKVQAPALGEAKNGGGLPVNGGGAKASAKAKVPAQCPWTPPAREGKCVTFLVKLFAMSQGRDSVSL